jgi:hypothetical protein
MDEVLMLALTDPPEGIRAIVQAQDARETQGPKPTPDASAGEAPAQAT